MANAATERTELTAVPVAPAVVLQFPLTAKETAPISVTVPPDAKPSALLPSCPACGERPAAPHRGLREWLQIALVVSLLAHAGGYVAMQWRFEDDLERTAGAAAAASEGAIAIPIEVVIDSVLPSAPSPTDASKSNAEQATPTLPDEKIAELMPVPPEPAPVVLPEAKIELPPPPEPAPVVLPKAEVELPPPPAPAPVVLPTQQQAMELALPEEEIAKPVEAKTAAIPEAPAPAMSEDEPPPLPEPRRAPPDVREKPREQPKQARRPASPAKFAPSRAASPSRAAGADSPGAAGAGGRADVGGRAAISSYFARVQAHLSRQSYPAEARANGASGVVRVVFALGRDGRVLAVSLAKGSGQSVLDRAALAMVRRAAPFPPFPPDIPGSRLELGAPIRFHLR